MPKHSWIVDVLEDLKNFARKNGLTSVEKSVDAQLEELRWGGDGQELFPEVWQSSEAGDSVPN